MPRYNLHHAANTGSVELALDLLSNGQVDIDQRDPKYCNRTPLMAASFHGHPDVVRVLLDNGASISAVDNEGYTALLFSAQFGHLAVTKMLMKAGSDPSTAESRDENTPLHLASFGGHSTFVKMFIEAGVDVAART